MFQDLPLYFLVGLILLEVLWWVGVWMVGARLVKWISKRRE